MICPVVRTPLLHASIDQIFKGRITLSTRVTFTIKKLDPQFPYDFSVETTLPRSECSEWYSPIS